MRIISASRRTDIPAFYSAWLLNRLHAGFCHWINPFGGTVYRVSLRPEDCLAIVFWTRNATPLLPHLSALRADGYRFYFHVTINGYPAPLETHSPPPAAAVTAFQRLSDAVSPDLALWRYDPIVLSDLTPPAYHLAQFDLLSRQLQGYTTRCYFSFVDFYGKTERNLKQVATASGISFQRPLPHEQRSLVQQLRQIAEQRGITLYSCCEKELVGEGVAAGALHRSRHGAARARRAVAQAEGRALAPGLRLRGSDRHRRLRHLRVRLRLLLRHQQPRRRPAPPAPARPGRQPVVATGEPARELSCKTTEVLETSVV